MISLVDVMKAVEVCMLSRALSFNEAHTFLFVQPPLGTTDHMLSLESLQELHPWLNFLFEIKA